MTELIISLYLGTGVLTVYAARKTTHKYKQPLIWYLLTILVWPLYWLIWMEF